MSASELLPDQRDSVLHYQLHETSNPQKAVLLHQKMIYSLKLMIWNNTLALVKNQFLLFGEGLDKVFFSLSGPQTTILNYDCSRTKLHLDCGLGTFAIFSFH